MKIKLLKFLAAKNLKEMSLFEILKRYTFNEDIITLLSEFEKGFFGKFSYDKCILGMKDHRVNLSKLSATNTVQENGKIFNEFIAFLEDCGWKSRCESKVYASRGSVSSDTDESLEWKKQKKDNKDRLIHHFILFLKDTYHLSCNEQMKLENLLAINIKLNYISSQHIIIENGEIKEIKNLSFDTTTREWKLDAKPASYQPPPPESDAQGTGVSKIYSKIDKYLEYRKVI